LKIRKAQADDGDGFPETTGLETDMGTASQNRRLERLEAHVRAAQNREGEFYLCRQLIYDPHEWDIDKEEAISRMMADERDRLVAAGEIRDEDRDRVQFIVRIIVDPPKREDAARSSPDG
jgi:hypothetical protein